MAITDDQLEQLSTWAYELGRDGVLNHPSDGQVISAVFDRAEIESMRTEDEFNEIVTPADLPDMNDHTHIVNQWRLGQIVYEEQGALNG